MDEPNIWSLGQFLEVGPQDAQPVPARNPIHFVQRSMDEGRGMYLVTLAKPIYPFHAPPELDKAIKCRLPGRLVNHKP
jgi:hypothetical protein